ncbi:hypothetical protein [Rheinheimera sp.]|uniref:hypothetical protein n=1 Tax=Rheinheimera sp. TaxID=1869214 RepID=UPI0027B922D6|nr:hypothetical protein [Rheinheimera sp.]
MDVLFPYLPRVMNQPVDSSGRLILPVAKYERIHAEPSSEQRQRVGMRDPRQYQQPDEQQPPEQKSEHQSEQQQSSQQTQETQLLPTGHAVTPEQDQHADADGHLDIYV